ncbi:uncharacterized protein [Oscarella lobularis]|uniref:uncharacterized protein isoform X2 n=1 Tax=Oscarella lobularis TaxID=121494 RepID=UPI0033138E43
MLLGIIVGATLLQIIAAEGGSFWTSWSTTCPQSCQPQEGQKGFPGFPGMKGFMGDKGATGPRGRYPPWWHWHTSPGVPGIPGHPGKTGEDGYPGSRGEKGRTGSPGYLGSPGLKGDLGSEGRQGAIGMKGSEGDHGLRGVPGERGDKGMQGRKGNRGTVGDDGMKGTQGERGDFGNPGDNGNQGPRGAEGPKGMNGTKGDRGHPATGGVVHGQKGDKGQKGQKGAKGLKGKDGDRGDPGQTGPNITNVNGVLNKPCNQRNEGQIYHDATTKEIVFCDGDQWKCAVSDVCEECVEKTTYSELTVGGGLPKRKAADIVLIVDDSGSMKKAHSWIPRAAEALEDELLRAEIGTIENLPNKYYVVRFGLAGGSRSEVVTVSGSAALEVTQVTAAMQTFTEKGNSEDGYEAIERALSIKELRSHEDVALNLALVTDEPRDPLDVAAGTKSSLTDIREKLLNRNATLNLLGKFNFTSTEISGKIAAIDYVGHIHFVNETTVSTDGFQNMKKTSMTLKDPPLQDNDDSCRSFVVYAPLAMSTGGAVWNLGVIKTTKDNDEERVAFTKTLARIKVEEVLMRSVCAECNVKCVGPEQKEVRTCNKEIEQIYCRCRMGGKSYEECKLWLFNNSSNLIANGLQSAQYDFSPIYKTCEDHGFPTKYEGWCDSNWPFGSFFSNRLCGGVGDRSVFRYCNKDYRIFRDPADNECSSARARL